MLNSLAIHNELDYWMILGDSFYDKGDTNTRDFFQGLSLETTSRSLGMVLGNHDFWFCGKPQCKTHTDTFGYGRIQWYAQDTIATSENDTNLFDFGVGPASQDIPAIENTFWFHAIGNVAIIGFCNAYSWGKSLPYFTRACKWVEETSPSLVLLIGHWTMAGMGAPADMGTGDVSKKITNISGCDNLGGRLKVVAAHWHFNKMVWKDTAFVFGSNGIGPGGLQLGFPILDTRHGRVKLIYFKLGEDGEKVGNFDEILGCISAKGYVACEHYAEVWLNQSLAGE